MQRAGGIGGLLARSQPGAATAQVAFYQTDGNGNVTALINTNQVIVAKYVYDSYGNIESQTGPVADSNLYRFSSKEFHANSGTYYYLYRFYDPNLQRWLNRDPMGEDGGLNLYGFALNCPTRYVDPLGLCYYCPGNISPDGAYLQAAGDDYPTCEAAAKAALSDAYKMSKTNKVEHAGIIYAKGNEAYSYTESAPGLKTESWPGGATKRPGSRCWLP